VKVPTNTGAFSGEHQIMGKLRKWVVLVSMTILPTNIL
jgi:hypothetical protein